MPDLQFAAQSYQARSTQLIAQEAINCFVETSPHEAKTPVPVYGSPGLSVFARTGKGGVQGLWIMGGLLYAVSGGVLWSIDSTGHATQIGATNLSGVCVMADNGHQLVMVDGFAGWIYQPGGLNQITTQTITPLYEIDFTVTGTITNGDTASIRATSVTIAGSPVTVTYPITGASTTTTIAAGLAAAINANTRIHPTGTLASSVGNVLKIQWDTTVPIGFAGLVSAGATEILTPSAVTETGRNMIPANISGTITSGDTLLIPMDNGSTWTTTAVGTFTAADTIIVVADGPPAKVSAGATIIDPSATLTQIQAAAFQPPCYVTFMDGYFVFAATGTRLFFLSAINDGTQYSGLDFATATANTGYVLAVLNFHEQLLIFTSKACTEVWYDSGASAFPFQRYDGVYIQRGLSNSLALASEDNTCFWMGDDGIFYRNNGFLPERISTYAMEHAWAQYQQKYFDCVAFVLDQEGHKFCVLNFLSGQATWVYDLSTKIWHQRESHGSPWV